MTDQNQEARDLADKLDGLCTPEWSWKYLGAAAKLLRALSTDAESALKARDAEIERLRGDAEWRPIETAPKGCKLIVGYFNKLGNWRTVMGRYYLPKTLINENDNLDLDEDDDGYAPEGWYEESESQSSILPTDEPPTHWKPLSKGPDAAIDQARATGGEKTK